MEVLALKSFLTLLVVMDPIGLVPMYLALNSAETPAEHKRIARRAVLVAGGILFTFILGGAWFLENLGISLEAFRIAGGILLFKIAVDMVFAHRERETPEEEEEARAREDISVFPLAIPFLAGPGALASVMILSGEAMQIRPLAITIVLGSTVLVLILAYIALRLAVRLARLLGQTGINVITRVLGVLLAAMAVQYVVDGVLVIARLG